MKENVKKLEIMQKNDYSQDIFVNDLRFKFFLEDDPEAIIEILSEKYALSDENKKDIMGAWK